MANSFDLLRRRNLFAPPTRPAGFSLDQPAPPAPGLSMGAPRPLPPDEPEGLDEDDSDNNYFDMIRKLSQPGPKMTAYQAALEKSPQEADYQPTKKGRLLAALAGFATGMKNPAAGFTLAKGITQDPYERALRQHAMELQQTGTGANLERMAAQDQLKEISAARSMGLKYSEFKLKQAQAAALDRYRQGELGIRGDELGIRRQDSATRVRQAGAAEERNRITNELNQGNLKLRGQEVAIRGQEANTRKAAQRSLETYHNVMGDAYKKRTEAISSKDKVQNSTQQAAAIQNAYQTLRLDPKWSEYIIADESNPGKLMPKAPDKSRTYEMFRKELERRVTTALSQGSPVFQDEEDDGSGDEEDRYEPFER
jgi:hypothetical protein